MPAQVPHPGAGEFHPIYIRLDEDSTEVRCAEPGCGFCEGTGSTTHVLTHAVTHAADHTLATGHTVTERHVVVSTIRECA